MANRDKSQNVGFVYTNIYQIYKKAQNTAPAASGANTAAATAQKITSDQRVWRAEDLADVKITKFEPRTLAAARPVLTEADANAKALHSGNPFDDLKANLTKLQDLHSKLRFMLSELEGLVGKK
ncbi:MAG: hypothetical protein HY074_03800 [Deltaproteobacteria bacterium]|nr:hypothetical protein [Deltaproteobacteria bacterium]